MIATKILAAYLTTLDNLTAPTVTAVFIDEGDPSLSPPLSLTSTYTTS